MKKLNLIIFCILCFTTLCHAQAYLGRNWVDVQYQLASKRKDNTNLYVELTDRDSINHVYHTISLVEKEKRKKRDWVLIQTAFNDNGICYYECYSDLKNKTNALQKAKLILKGYTLKYSSSTANGLMDKYVVLKNGEIIEDLTVEIGSTEELPDDIMITIGSRNIYKSTKI